MNARLLDDLTAEVDQMVALRRDIHAHPELGFDERRTADLVAARLAEWGIPMHRGMAQTAVIGIVHGRDGGACGRAIGLRADMDALPLHEMPTPLRIARNMPSTGRDARVWP